MTLDRSKTSPTLLRCFWKMHRNNSINSYRMSGQGVYPNQEVQIYTWPDATLRELCELLQNVVPSAADYNARLDLSLVFLDKNGNYSMKQIGQVSLGTPGTDDGKSLADCNFVAGDYLDIAVRFSNRDGAR